MNFRVSPHLEIIKQLQDGKSDNNHKDMERILGYFLDSTDSIRLDIWESSFPSFLLDILINNSHLIDDKILSAKGLHTLISSDICDYKEKFKKAFNKLEMNFRGQFNKTVLPLFYHKNNNLSTIVIKLIGVLASKTTLSSLREDAILALIEVIQKYNEHHNIDFYDGEETKIISENEIKNEKKESNEQLSDSKYNLNVTLRAIALISASSEEGLFLCREKIIGILLFSSFSYRSDYKESSMNALVSILTRPPQEQQKMTEEKEKLEENFTSRVACMIAGPLSDIKMPSEAEEEEDVVVTSEYLKIKETQKHIAQLISLRALSFLYEASPKLGEKTIKISGVLDKVIILSQSKNEPKVQRMVAQVLACCTSDQNSRNLMANSDAPNTLLHILTKSDDIFSQCHAGLALSKLSVFNEELQKEKKTKTVLNVMSEFLFKIDNIPTKILGQVVESIAFLTLHIDMKKEFVSANESKYLRALFSLASKSDRHIRFGVSQILVNLCTSSSDLEREYTAEIQKLRNVAAKGLPQEAERKKLLKRAGSPEEIQEICKIVVKQNGLKTLVDCTGSSLEQIYDEKLCFNLSMVLLNMASDIKNRGYLVAQGGFPLMFQIFRAIKGGPLDEKGDKIKERICLALSRISITVNPNLFPFKSRHSLIPPLLWLCKNGTHELHLFEALMALTNLASMKEMRTTIVSDKNAWSDIRLLLAENQTQIQRACLECLANLVFCEESITRLRTTAGETDVKLFLAFSIHEDLSIARAAAGALAMMSYDLECSKQIAYQEKTFEQLKEATTAHQDDGYKERLACLFKNLHNHGFNLNENYYVLNKTKIEQEKRNKLDKEDLLKPKKLGPSSEKMTQKKLRPPPKGRPLAPSQKNSNSNSKN